MNRHPLLISIVLGLAAIWGLAHYPEDGEVAVSLGVVIATIVALAIYFIPSMIACGRGHPRTLTIVLINLLLGWTGIAWIATLIWAVRR